MHAIKPHGIHLPRVRCSIRKSGVNMRGFTILFVVITTYFLCVTSETTNNKLRKQSDSNFKSGLILYNSFMDGFTKIFFGKRFSDMHLLKWFSSAQKNDNEFLKNFDRAINTYERKNTMNKIMKTVQSYYKIAMDNIEIANIADTLFDGVGSVFKSVGDFFDGQSYGHGQGGGGGGGGPSFTTSITQNFNYFYKSVTGFIGMSDVNNISDLVFEQFTSMFDYVSDWIGSFNKPKIKKKIGRSLNLLYTLMNDTNIRNNSVMNKIHAVFDKFERAELKFQLSSDIVQIKLKRRNVGAIGSNRQIQMKIPMTKMFQFLLFPALAMTGIMPYVLPPLKMGVMFVSTLTNMAFMTALVSLVRGIIFDPDPSRRVVYPNYGYKKNRHRPFGPPDSQL